MALPFPAGSVMHCVNFAAKDGADLEPFMAEVREFPKKMPDLVLYASAGPTFTTERAKDCTHGICVVLKDKDSLPLYSKGEIHQEFLSRFVPAVDMSKTTAVDWVN